jgi:peptidoglycan/LPS O-acetylase OafA/YrhL
VALMFVFFVFVVDGNSLFGLLRTRPAKLLGMVSYSIYLTHCIVLFVVVHSFNAAVPVATLDAAGYWLLAAFAAAVTVVLSAATYQYVEYPFLAPRRPHARPAAVKPIMQSS